MAKQSQETESSSEKFVNPFKEGVSLESFINALGASKVTDYLNGNFKSENEPFTDTDASWLESEIKKHAYNKENKDSFLAQAQKEHVALVMGNKKNIEQ